MTNAKIRGCDHAVVYYQPDWYYLMDLFFVYETLYAYF
jgi:hypothetical protein